MMSMTCWTDFVTDLMPQRYMYVFLFQIASKTVVVARCAVLFVLQSIAYVPRPLNFRGRRHIFAYRRINRELNDIAGRLAELGQR
jgi:hypothetical protein